MGSHVFTHVTVTHVYSVTKSLSLTAEADTQICGQLGKLPYRMDYERESMIRPRHDVKAAAKD